MLGLVSSTCGTIIKVTQIEEQISPLIYYSSCSKGTLDGVVQFQRPDYSSIHLSTLYHMLIL